MGRYLLFRPSTRFPGDHFNTGQNAIWLDLNWVNEPTSKESIRSLATELRDHQIRYVSVYTSYLKANDRFNPTYAYAADFTRSLKSEDRGVIVLAWIGLPLESSTFPSGNGNVDLSNPRTRQYIASFCADRITQDGFDGVHLDPEPVPNGDEDLLTLLDDVRQTIPKSSLLSLATRHIQPIMSDTPVPVLDQLLWQSRYYSEVADRVDQVALMTYDSHLPLGTLYRTWVRFQVIALTDALKDTNRQVLIGVPTSEERTPSHWPGAENMETGLSGTIDGLNDKASVDSVVTGVAIYPEWETGQAEWQEYQSLWLRR
ncbi:MAG TPA: glycosyl hydrolase family 18 protein [Chloroflexota bacterium]|nr:glycosyl hydrolase family 18 protein [Chloroflexota bacterium]